MVSIRGLLNDVMVSEVQEEVHHNKQLKEILYLLLISLPRI